MSPREYTERIGQLDREHASFALATVVVRRAPVSAHLGDRAIVLADGRMEGFVGGACSRDIVRRQGLDAIRSGRPRLLRIRPSRMDTFDEEDTSEMIVVPMSCASEGAVDVYIEPRLPPRTLLIAGYTPVADALARLGACMEGYRVVRAVAADEMRDLAGEEAPVVAIGDLPAHLDALDAADRARTIAVVASQGHYDEAALEALLDMGQPPAFVGLLASRKRAASVFGVLQQDGIEPERIASVHVPVGLDVGARTPDDVAIAILAQVVAEGVCATGVAPAEIEARVTAIDPICCMEVDVASTSHRAEHEGVTYYFCCANCRAAFMADPASYVAAATQR